MPPPGYLRGCASCASVADEVLVWFGRASTVGAIGAMQDEGTVAAATHLGREIGPRLGALADRHPSMGDVRGIGGLWTVELVRDRRTKEPIVPTGRERRRQRADGRV